MPVHADDMPMSTRRPPTIRQLVFDLGKIVEGAVLGDSLRVHTYTERLASRLQDAGEEQAASRLRGLLSSTNARGVRVSDLMTERPAVPVDGESRLPIADLDPSPSGADVLVLDDDPKWLVDKFVESVRFADRLAARGLSVAPSMLIHGPPGVGKSLVAKWIAQSLALPLVTGRIDALVSSYLGSTAKNIRHLFEFAASRPCVLFLDEFDSLGKMRDDSHELGELKRVVISLLQNIDALGPDHVLLAATNHEHLLDPAVWRRFTYKLRLDLPSEHSRRAMFHHALNEHLDDMQINALAAFSVGASGAEIATISDDALRSMVISGSERVLFIEVLEALCRSQGSSASRSTSPDELVKALSERVGDIFTQRQIGDLVGLSQSRVSRILKTAMRKD